MRAHASRFWPMGVLSSGTRSWGPGLDAPLLRTRLAPREGRETPSGRAPRVAPGVGGDEGDGGEREAFERGERERQRERERGRGGEDTVVRGDERLAFGSPY